MCDQEMEKLQGVLVVDPEYLAERKVRSFGPCNTLIKQFAGNIKQYLGLRTLEGFRSLEARAIDFPRLPYYSFTLSFIGQPRTWKTQNPSDQRIKNPSQAHQNAKIDASLRQSATRHILDDGIKFKTAFSPRALNPSLPILCTLFNFAQDMFQIHITVCQHAAHNFF